MAVPVPESGIPRALVDAARIAIRDNRRPSRSGYKFWELSGLLRCSSCGYMMNSRSAGGGKSRERRYFYYRCGGYYGSRNGCDHAKNHRAEEVEARVWEYVRGHLEDPEALRADLEHMIEMERGNMHGDPEKKAHLWVDKLAETDRLRARAQDGYLAGVFEIDELRAKLAALEDTRRAAEEELIALKDHREHVVEMERSKEAVLGHYAAIAPQALDVLTPEERRQLYGMLCLKAVQHPDGKVEAEVSGTSRPDVSQTENTSACVF